MELARRKIDQTQANRTCLWPDKYASDDLETALRFVYDCCRTWDPTAGGAGVYGIPEKPHLEVYAQEYFRAKEQGGTLIVEKTRRRLISWMDRALTLHQLGLSRKSWLLSGETFGPACRHVWRLEFIYKDLQTRFREWKLPDNRGLHFEGPESLKLFGLENGSLCTAVNAEGGKIQGEGMSGITMEEGSLYPYLQEMLGQSKIVKQGKAGGRDGFIVVIANPEPSFPWKCVRAGGKDHVGAFERWLEGVR